MKLVSEAFVTRIGLALMALLAAVLLAVGPAYAQTTYITPRLVAESTAPAPGGTTTLALAMTPEKPWHGYWANGGDAGFGLTVDWNGSVDQRIGIANVDWRKRLPTG